MVSEILSYLLCDTLTPSDLGVEKEKEKKNLHLSEQRRRSSPFPQLQFSRVLEDVVDAIGVCGTPYGASRG